MSRPVLHLPGWFGDFGPFLALDASPVPISARLCPFLWVSGSGTKHHKIHVYPSTIHLMGGPAKKQLSRKGFVFIGFGGAWRGLLVACLLVACLRIACLICGSLREGANQPVLAR